MLVATFGPTTGWAGKGISREGGTFILDGRGAISARDLLKYDQPDIPDGLLMVSGNGSRSRTDR